MNFLFKKAKDKIEFSIQDTGTGIKSEYFNSIFDLGFTTTDGSGIGLYQARDIVENELNGFINFDTNSDGTIFKITF